MGTKNQEIQERLTIARLANAACVGVSTIRYYQQRGLMRIPNTPISGGVRIYGQDDVAHLLLIRRAQELGFSLSEIAELAVHARERNCNAIFALADLKLAALRKQAGELEIMRNTLESLIAECQHDSFEVCPLILKLCGGGTNEG